jgi:capsular polysaccharide transport system ATP-binding protein
MVILDDVWKSYPVGDGHRDVLRGVNCTIRPGDAIGVLGRNGAGKSTLLRVISGVEHPNRGRVHRGMSVSWPLAAGMGVQASLSGNDNARFIARLYGQDVGEMLRYVREFSELGSYLAEPVRTYSAGMHAKLMFALSLAVDFDCYLIDETTSVGDAKFNQRAQEALTQRLEHSSLLLVSHHPDHIRFYCRSAAVLNAGTLRMYEDIDEAIAAYYSL